jgi:hypothetical protein
MNEFGHELRFGLRDEQELSRIVQRLADMPLFVTRPGESLCRRQDRGTPDRAANGSAAAVPSLT